MGRPKISSNGTVIQMGLKLPPGMADEVQHLAAQRLLRGHRDGMSGAVRELIAESLKRRGKRQADILAPVA